jgi:hypothetical protein
MIVLAGCRPAQNLKNLDFGTENRTSVAMIHQHHAARRQILPVSREHTLLRSTEKSV